MDAKGVRVRAGGRHGRVFGACQDRHEVVASVRNARRDSIFAGATKVRRLGELVPFPSAIVIFRPPKSGQRPYGPRTALSRGDSETPAMTRSITQTGHSHWAVSSPVEIGADRVRRLVEDGLSTGFFRVSSAGKYGEAASPSKTRRRGGTCQPTRQALTTESDVTSRSFATCFGWLSQRGDLGARLRQKQVRIERANVLRRHLLERRKEDHSGRKCQGLRRKSHLTWFSLTPRPMVVCTPSASNAITSSAHRYERHYTQRDHKSRMAALAKDALRDPFAII